MTKEEFLSIIYDEIENLEEERENISSKTTSIEEVEAANYQLKLIDYKLNAIRDLISLPIYARIQSMSVGEIEEYKKKRIDNLERELQKIESDEVKYKEKMDQQENEVTTEISNILSEKNQDADIKEFDELIEKLGIYSSSRKAFLSEISKKKDAIHKEIDAIRKKTSQEIKEEFLSKINGKEALEEKIKGLSENATEKMMAVIGNDYDKVKNAVELLSEFYSYDVDMLSLTVHLDFGDKLPKKLEEIISEKCGYDFVNGEIHNPKLVESSISEFNQNHFYITEFLFENNFNEEMLDEIVDSNFSPDSNVYIDFFKRHRGHCPKDKFENLMELIQKRNIIIQFIGKLASFFGIEIESLTNLNNAIYYCQTSLYRDIKAWYKKKEEEYRDVLGFTSGISLDNSNREQLRRELERCYEEIAETKKEVDELSNRLKEAENELEEEKDTISAQKRKITDKVWEIAGEKPKSIDAGMLDKGEEQDFLEAAGRNYIEKLVNRVFEEAQRQVNNGENLTLEELLNNSFDLDGNLQHKR